MKKTLLTIAILFGLGMTSFAGGGLFQRDINAEYGKSGFVYYDVKGDIFLRQETPAPLLPGHGEFEDQAAPLGSGIALFMSLGAAYLVGKKHREE